MNPILIALMLFAGQPVQRDVLAGASLTGKVTMSGLTQGLPDSRVLLTRVGGRLADSMVTTTDSNGRFSLNSIPPGTYRVFADHEDFVREEYGQRAAGRPGSPVTLNSGQQLDEINLSLMQTGAITGRVTDMDGTPVSKVYVRTFVAAYAQGERTLKIAAETQTNDLGEYRLYGLPPGTYFVSAAPYKTPQIHDGTYAFPTPPRLDSFGEGQGMTPLAGLLSSGGSIHPFAITGETYAPVYYPGTLEEKSAKALDLRPGAVLTGVDFQTTVLPRRVGFRVRGQFIDSTSGQIVTGVQWSLGQLVFDVDSRIGSSASGTFEFADIPAGRYQLSGSSDTGAPRSLIGKMTIEVSNANLDNVRVLLSAPIDISGRITGMTPDLSGATIMLQPANGGRQAIRPDGTFSLTDVQVGDYRLILKSAPPNYYLKSAQIGQTNVSAGLHVDGTPPGPVTILVSPNAGGLDGVVLDNMQHPAAAEFVVLIPDSTRRSYYDFYRTTATDTSGSFHIEGIVPGEYKAFAWDDIEENSWQDPDILQKYEDRGIAVHVGEGSSGVVSLTAIPSH